MLCMGIKKKKQKNKNKKKQIKTESKYKVLGKVTNIRKHVSLFQSETFNFTLL